MPHRIQPKILFLIDAIGALLSAIFLGGLLPKIHTTIGVPEKTLLLLASIALLLAVYSFYHFIYFPERWQFRLKIIAFLNLCYALFTIGIVIQLHDEMLPRGYAYFSFELMIIVALAFYELKRSTEIVV